jgi:drug/metabolite transporter (DMT)-like permease
MTPLWAYVALGAAILVGVGGQLLLKVGADAGGSVVAQFTRPVTVAGLALYAIAALLYIVALRRLPVSVAFPTVSLSYVLVAVAANHFWNEPFGWHQVAGLVLITAGVAVIHQAA